MQSDFSWYYWNGFEKSLKISYIKFRVVPTFLTLQLYYCLQLVAENRTEESMIRRYPSRLPDDSNKF